VKCISANKITTKGETGPPVIELQPTWKGYEGAESTTEQWGNMKRSELKQLVETYQLFNKLKKK
jgi:hypothetical protein